METVRELVHKDPIVLQQRCFHRRTTDVELLKDVHAYKESGSKGDDHYENPVSKNSTGAVPLHLFGLNLRCC